MTPPRASNSPSPSGAPINKASIFRAFPVSNLRRPRAPYAIENATFAADGNTFSRCVIFQSNGVSLLRHSC